MNIFILDRDPHKAATEMCDKHVVKMIVESAQMLSTAHRVLDGKVVKRPSVSGKRVLDYYQLDDWREPVMYRAAHVKHPCNIWIRKSTSNYYWLFNHFQALVAEYKLRFQKEHKCTALIDPLSCLPFNLSKGNVTEHPQAMPDECKDSDVVLAYRKYYNNYKSEFATWRIREVPHWFVMRNSDGVKVKVEKDSSSQARART